MNYDEKRLAEAIRVLEGTDTSVFKNTLDWQTLVVDVAKALGFPHATHVWWDPESSEQPVEDLDEYAAEADVGAVGMLDLGVFLGDCVHVRADYIESADEYVAAVFDTAKEAETTQ